MLCYLFFSCSVDTFILSFFFFFNDTATTEIYTLSLHDALPIFLADGRCETTGWFARECDYSSPCPGWTHYVHSSFWLRSEEHTSELQSPCNLVCRLLLEKKKKKVVVHLTVVINSRTCVKNRAKY